MTIAGAWPWSVAWRRETLDLLLWLRHLGALGALLYGAFYVLGTVALVSGTILTLGAGAIYGPLWGVLLVVPASLTGASLSFLAARRLGRRGLHRWLARHREMNALDQAVARNGFRVILLLRLDPIFLPFAPLNYALGLTGVGFRDYLLASGLGMFPASVVYVYFGSLLPHLSDLDAAALNPLASWRPWLLLAGVLVLVSVGLIVRRGARRMLHEQGLNEHPRKEPAS